MKISAKGRYALASLLYIADKTSSDDYITISSISKALSISKIYLEQTFTLLKKADLVLSVKGAQGGYQLARDPKKIEVLDILFATETSLFDRNENFVGDPNEMVNTVLTESVAAPLDTAIENFLSSVTLYDLLKNLHAARESSEPMFYI